jgi:DNA-binding MarR family transcriptional regulator
MKSLQQEIKLTRPFDSLETEAFLNLIRTHETVMRSVSEFFRDSGLTQTLYNVLRIIRGAGDQGVTCTQIGERIITRVPDVTRLIDRLTKAKLVRRVRNNDDRRVVELFLTTKGSALLEKMDGPLTNLHQENFSHMNERELTTLIRLLTKMRQGNS